MIGIISAAILIPLVAFVGIFCCWRRRNQKQRVGKMPVSISACGSQDADERMRQHFTLEGTAAKALFLSLTIPFTKRFWFELTFYEKKSKIFE